MTKKLFLLCIVVCLVLSSAALPAYSGETATAVYLDASDFSKTEKNEQFTLPVKTLRDSGIYSYELIISFDSDYLIAMDISGSGGGIGLVKEIDNTDGKIKFWYCVNDQPLRDNTLATITFKVIEIGIAEVKIEEASKFLRKPAMDDKTGDVDIEIDWDYGSDYPGEVELEVGVVPPPKFVSENGKTVFPFTLKVELETEEKGAVIYYSTSSNRQPNERYYDDDPIVLSATTTIYALAEKNGVYSKTVSKKYTRETGGIGGGGSGSYGTIVQTPAPSNNTNTPANEPKYKDIENHWSKPYFEKLIAKGIVSGYEDDTIRPDNRITRAEAAKIIIMAINLSPSNGAGLDFADAGEIADWAKGYIAAAIENGIITGYEDNTFKPARSVTRSELVVLAARAFKLAAENTEEISFADKAEIPDWAADSIAAALKRGLVSGYEDNTFKPYNFVTRAEASKIISEAINLSN